MQVEHEGTIGGCRRDAASAVNALTAAQLDRRGRQRKLLSVAASVWLTNANRSGHRVRRQKAFPYVSIDFIWRHAIHLGHF